MLVGIDYRSFSELSPNIVRIKTTTHYALHSNDPLYCTAVNSVICTAYLESYEDGYAEQVLSVHAALLTLKTLILGLNCIIP